ncbi:MAG: wax ester/triacylglycerol synthase family O-acyltransferase [Pseudomonadota bacterium]
MKQLSGLDATFLYMETEETPMHVAGLTVVELPKGFRGSYHKQFQDFFKTRIHLVPIFGMKLAKSAFQLDHPGWVDAGEVDIDYHIPSIKLPKPGTQEQLEALVAELHAERLDRSKPLWQFTVIEGIEGRRAALYSKMHHAAVDGAAGMAIGMALFDLSPEPRKVEAPKPKEVERKPTAPERTLLTFHDIVTNLARQQLLAIESVPKALSQMADLITPVLTGKVSIPQMLAPRTPFNVTVTAERTFAARSLSLSDAKAITKATGCKLNDVVMAVTAGAVRKYLSARQQLPDSALMAFVPISLREAGNTDTNNQVFGMNCSLATNYGDPAKRLEKITAESRATKTLSSSVKDAAPTDFTLVGAPTILPGLMQLFGGSRLADMMPSAVNMCISNTMGPPVPVFLAGAEVQSLYPVSIATHGVGLNVTVQSYRGKLDFGLTAGANAVPDMAELADLFEGSMAELKASVEKKFGTAKA